MAKSRGKKKCKTWLDLSVNDLIKMLKKSTNVLANKIVEKTQ